MKPTELLLGQSVVDFIREMGYDDDTHVSRIEITPNTVEVTVILRGLDGKPYVFTDAEGNQTDVLATQTNSHKWTYPREETE